MTPVVEEIDVKDDLESYILPVSYVSSQSDHSKSVHADKSVTKSQKKKKNEKT